MLLSELLKGIRIFSDYEDREITDVTDKTQAISEGCAFVCVVGARFDGHTFAQKAIEQGAKAVIVSKDMGLKEQILVENPREAYAIMCKNLNDCAVDKLTLIGITGTNGKTTTAFVVKDILLSLGIRSGLIGTVKNMVGDKEFHTELTTPDPYDMHKLFKMMVDDGIEYCVMETSSQAFHQMRLAGIHFKTGVFTNLTQDHLDYHKTMENYFDAKCILFENSRNIVVNTDDSYGKIVAQRYKDKNLITFSAKNDDADFTAKNINFTHNSVKFLMVGKGSINRVNFPMPGEYSVHNAMGAALACVALDIDESAAANALNNVKGVKGRCEILVKEPFTVICDYAHTGDGLENVLSSLRPFVQGRFMVLFGCAGERDKTKRIAMAEAVAKYADFVVLTSDNPRKEDPQSIIDSVKGYFEDKNIPYIAEVDRRKAINIALDMLQYNETLILCGKGHEDYQVLNGITVYLDEHEIVAKFMDKYNKGK